MSADLDSNCCADFAELEPGSYSVQFSAATSEIATGPNGLANGQGFAIGVVSLNGAVAELPLNGLLFLSPVGSPGNSPDVSGLGQVDYPFDLSYGEVTNEAYAELLNAVATATDPGGLYNPLMGSDPLGGIERIGGPGSFSYQAIANREDHPVNFVSFYDAIRFANWLHNDSPTGDQTSATTENGAYLITEGGILANDIVRSPYSRFALPTEDELYKAAYYDPDSDSYELYPGGAAVTCTADQTISGANCENVVGDLQSAFSYPHTLGGSSSYNLGGNVWELTETVSLSGRIIRGGAFDSPLSSLESSHSEVIDPAYEAANVGFRVVPEPRLASLLLPSLILLLALHRARVCESEG